MNNGLLNLKDCTAGETVTICSISPRLSCAQRLRELGLVEGSSVLLLKQEDPVLLLVKDSRIAIDPSTAREITVSLSPDGQPAANHTTQRADTEAIVAGRELPARGHGH